MDIFFHKFGELWFWGPALPFGDMHQSVTDAIVIIIISTLLKGSCKWWYI